MVESSTRIIGEIVRRSFFSPVITLKADDWISLQLIRKFRNLTKSENGYGSMNKDTFKCSSLRI